MMRISCLLAFATLALPAAAGSLTPPGPPASTMKTLDEVEARTPVHEADIPLTISRPGSYYLAEDIYIPSPTSHAVSITTSNVTLDLNGFTLSSSRGSGDFTGINADGAFEDIVVRNGTVSNWSGSGIVLKTGPCRIEDVVARQNIDYGIRIWVGDVINCTGSENGLNGIAHYPDAVLGSSIIQGCKADRNGESGISVYRPGLVSGNSCSRNQGSGIYLAAPGLVVENNHSSMNGSSGISSNANAGNSTIAGNTCTGNEDTGILVTPDGCRVDGNNVSSSIFGLVLNGKSIALRNTAHGNDTNFQFATGSVYGPIINMALGGAINSGHSWANIEY